MRLLHVLAERGFSGGEVQLEYLVRHLHDHGHDNAFVLAPGARFARVPRELGLPIAYADLRRPWWPPAVAALRRAVRAHRPDVLHFGCGRSLLWGGVATLGLEVRVRVTTRRIDYPISRAWHHGGRYRWLVDHVVANCEGVRRRVLAAGVPGQRVTVVHEGIDPEPFSDLHSLREAARERLGLPAGAVVVGCAATLRPRKGQRLLVEAVAHEGFEDVVCVLAGEGTHRRALERLVRRRGLAARVRLPGVVSPIQDLLAACDLFCMPSHHEGLSNACLEAAAAGLPLVVSDAGGLPEIVEDGTTGRVVPAGDVPALREALLEFVRDPRRRVAAGRAGAERVGRLFTAARMAESMESLFQRLLVASNHG